MGISFFLFLSLLVKSTLLEATEDDPSVFSVVLVPIVVVVVHHHVFREEREKLTTISISVDGPREKAAKLA
jgi:hypothetical protein